MTNAITSRALTIVIVMPAIVTLAHEFGRRAIQTHTICYGSPNRFEPYFDFIASHYDMVLIGEPEVGEEIAKRNSRIASLQYRIAQSMHTTYPDWDEVDQHEDWFIHAKGFVPTRDNRLRSTSFNEYLMDVGSTGWQDHYAKVVRKLMNENASCAGIFADNCWSKFSTHVGAWYRITPVEKYLTGGEKGDFVAVHYALVKPRQNYPVVKAGRGLHGITVHANADLEGPNYCDESKGCSWEGQTIKLNPEHLPGGPGTVVWVSYPAVCFPPDGLVEKYQDGILAIATKAKAALRNKLFIGNSGDRLYCERYLDAMDGVFVEGFVHSTWAHGDVAPTEKEWLEDIHALLRAQERNKWHLSHSGTDQKNSTPEQIEQWRHFCYASFLMGVGPKATFQYAAGPERGAPHYYPEWDLPIGKPKGRYAVKKVAGANIYQREFTNGIAIVNPSDRPKPITINLHGKYCDWQGKRLDEFRLARKHGAVLIRAQ